MQKCWKGVSYDVNWTGVSRVHLPTLSLNCDGIKHNADDRNIDMIFIMLLDNIHMGITSLFKDDATHLTYTPLEGINLKQSSIKN
jgi:hypothetical protein